ncbi:MAG: hypothetical protein A3F42_05190 [Gammaproteobacteria bacterium RIFCSPHIGHO2_12_FULL_37_34]|nr:MAG: hypothetical protein A3F42_05190 [Gammaproteobacteria bacterium RIFCSPHIGHO2_12_FULL_37_34]
MFQRKVKKQQGNNNEIRMIESKHIRDVLTHTSCNSFVIFDLDNTLVESTQEMGGDQWFVSLSQYAAKMVVDSAEAASLVLSIYHEVQFHIDLRAVQKEAIRIIQILQDLSIPVLALTTRGSKISEPTLSQLNKIGIHFSKQWSDDFIALPRHERYSPTFREGIIFCDGADKGKCLNEFFNYKQFYPEHVVMVDDKAKYLVSVGKVVTQYGAQFIGLRYGYLDEKIKTFNLEQSMQELIGISYRFPRPIQHVLGRLSITHDRYLQSNSIFSNNQREIDAIYQVTNNYKQFRI